MIGLAEDEWYNHRQGAVNNEIPYAKIINEETEKAK